MAATVVIAAQTEIAIAQVHLLAHNLSACMASLECQLGSSPAWKPLLAEIQAIGGDCDGILGENNNVDAPMIQRGGNTRGHRKSPDP